MSFKDIEVRSLLFSNKHENILLCNLVITCILKSESAPILFFSKVQNKDKGRELGVLVHTGKHHAKIQ